MKKKYLIFYVYKDNLLYYNNNIIKNDDECYKIIRKYKILNYLSNVKVLKQTYNESHNNLVFIGYDKNEKL